MRYYRFPENKITKIGFAVFLFAMLMLCRDTLVTSSILGFYKATFISYGLIALVGIAFLWVNRKNWKQILNDERMLLALVATVIFLVPMLVKQDWQLMYFSVLICIYFAIFLSYFVTLEEVAKVYVISLSLLGVYSCFANYFLVPFAKGVNISVPIFSNGVHDFYNFGLAFSKIMPYPYYRNFGIFREPGVYQFFVLTALVANNCIVSWKNARILWVNNIILTITMLTTFATGGIVELLLLIGVLFIDQKWYKKKRAWLVLGASVCLCLGICIKIPAIFDAVRYMLTKIFNFDPASSGGVRYQAILVDFRIFLENPLVGEKISNVMYADGITYNTTSTMILFAGYGLLAGCFHVISWIALLWDKNRKVWVNLALLLIMFMSFNTQDLTADIFLWLFPIMALVEKGIPFAKSLVHKKRA